MLTEEITGGRKCPWCGMVEIQRESKQTPEAVQMAVTRAGGVNRFGEPNYRVVWGWCRLTWIGGKWTDRDASGNVTREAVELRRVPKYIPHDRWHLERWLPPEAYGSPQSWHEQTVEKEDGILIPALGPYPTRGDYEHSYTLEGPSGEFLALTPSVVEAVVRAVERSRATTAAESHAALVNREERATQDWESAAENSLGL